MNSAFTSFYEPFSAQVKEKQKEFQLFLKKHNIKSEDDVKSLDAAAQKQLIALGQQIDEEHRKACEKFTAEQIAEILKPFAESYQKHAEELGKLGVPVFGILGNHDLNAGYEILKDNITLLEKANRAEAVIKGKTGLEFILKGDINTNEFPAFYAALAPLIAKQFIPYISGASLSELSREVNSLQAELSNSQNERLEKIAKKEEPKYSDEQLKEMAGELEQKIEIRKRVLEYNQAERRRLGDKTETNIYLSHRLPNCRKAQPVEGSLSDITLEYSAHARAVYGGHFHEGQIGCRTIEDFLKQEFTETASADGIEIPVFYLDGKEPWELNPGTNYFLVTEYGADKQVEQVVIHEFYYGEVA